MANSRLQEAVTQMVNQLDSEHLRKLQADTYRCSAKCCENNYYTMQDVQVCVDKCATPLNKAQQMMETELQSFQDRIQRCAMDCQDKARDKLGANPSEAEISKQRSLVEQCANKCMDDHVALIPSIKKRMISTLKK